MITEKERRAYKRERLEKLVEDGLVRRVPCPLCAAPEYEDCRSRESSYPTPWHRGRLDAAGLR